MSIEHKNIPDSELHEPKGAASATSGQVPVSDGAGGTSWALPQIQGQSTAASGTSPVSDGAGGVSWTAGVTAEWGAAFFKDSSANVTVSVVDTYYIIDHGTWSSVSGGTIPFTTNKFTIGTTGIYRIHANASLEDTTNDNDLMVFIVAVNGAESSMVNSRVQIRDFNEAEAVIHTFHELTAGDEISLMVKNVTDTADIGVQNASLNLELIKAT